MISATGLLPGEMAMAGVRLINSGFRANGASAHQPSGNALGCGTTDSASPERTELGGVSHFQCPAVHR